MFFDGWLIKKLFHFLETKTVGKCNTFIHK